MNYITVFPSPTSLLNFHLKEVSLSMYSPTIEPKDPKTFEVLTGNISTSGQCIMVGNLCLKFELTSIKISPLCFYFPPLGVIVIMAMKTLTMFGWLICARLRAGALCSWSVLLKFILPDSFFIVFVNTKGYVSKHKIIRNGSFVQELLHKFLNFMDLCPLFPLLIHKRFGLRPALLNSLLIAFPFFLMLGQNDPQDHRVRRETFVSLVD